MKQKNKISFRLVAYTDAAGKYSADSIRGGNEDNFFVDDDLTDNITNKVSQDDVIQLGNKGMIMAIADGMGGMNAGEVASQIAIDTVKGAFTTDHLKDTVVASADSRQKYLEQTIKTADRNIKSEARKDRSREGMGSTIIIAWLYDDELTISWCGDSRAYVFNDKSGIRLISQDHSYVQELVNKGLLKYAQTFDHPQNNIITRSLGDPAKDACPESKTLKVGKGDIILLCSDGLTGVLRDRKTYDDKGVLYPEKNIEDIIRNHTASMKECREALWKAAEQGGWYDNVTAILCQITEGPESLWQVLPAVPATKCKKNIRAKNKILIYGIVSLIVIVAVAFAFFIRKHSNNPVVDECMVNESIPAITSDSDNASDSVDVTEEKQENNVTEEMARPTVAEQIQSQNEEKADTVSKVVDELTEIKSKESKQRNSNGNGKLTPIQNRHKLTPEDNPIPTQELKNKNIGGNPEKNIK